MKMQKIGNPMSAVLVQEIFQAFYSTSSPSNYQVFNTYFLISNPVLCPTQNHLRNMRAGIEVLRTAQKGKKRVTFENTANGIYEIYSSWRSSKICEGCFPILKEKDEDNRLYIDTLKMITQISPLERQLMVGHATKLSNLLHVYDIVCIHGDKSIRNINALQRPVPDRMQQEEEEDREEEEDVKEEIAAKQEHLKLQEE